MIDLTRLGEPFDLSDLEFRIARSGEKNGKVWAMSLTYITARAIMDRLDEVCGAGNWQTDYRDIGGAMACGIGILIDREWIWKWDGAGHLEANSGLDGTDAGKGDFSNALKRAGVQWGVGRYLYGLTESFANVHDGGAFRGKAAGKPFRWDPPTLPAWALPKDAKPTTKQTTKVGADVRGEIQKLLSKASKGGHVSQDEGKKIMAALADADTAPADLLKTHEVLTRWIATKREAQQEATV